VNAVHVVHLLHVTNVVFNKNDDELKMMVVMRFGVSMPSNGSQNGRLFS